MAIKWEKVQAGMELFERHVSRGRYQQFRVRVISVDHTAGRAVVSWNGNPARSAPRRQVEKYYTWSMHDRTECEMIGGRPRRFSAAERARRKAENST